MRVPGGSIMLSLHLVLALEQVQEMNFLKSHCCTTVGQLPIPEALSFGILYIAYIFPLVNSCNSKQIMGVYLLIVTFWRRKLRQMDCYQPMHIWLGRAGGFSACFGFICSWMPAVL